MVKIINKTQFKERFYVFLKGIENCEYVVEEFWNEHEQKIYNWYREQHLDSDIIISASPEFLLRPIAKRIGIQEVIASRVNIKTGVYEGENCYGQEKVVRFCQVHRIDEISSFYSDSYSDKPMFDISEKNFIVKKGVPQEAKKGL